MKQTLKVLSYLKQNDYITRKGYEKTILFLADKKEEKNKVAVKLLNKVCCELITSGIVEVSNKHLEDI